EEDGGWGGLEPGAPTGELAGGDGVGECGADLAEALELVEGGGRVGVGLGCGGGEEREEDGGEGEGGAGVGHGVGLRQWALGREQLRRASLRAFLSLFHSTRGWVGLRGRLALRLRRALLSVRGGGAGGDGPEQAGDLADLVLGAVLRR